MPDTSGPQSAGVTRPIYDLSVPIVDGMDWYGYPETAPVQLREVGSLRDHAWRSHWLSMMVLNGTTYLETAATCSQMRRPWTRFPPRSSSPAPLW